MFTDFLIVNKKILPSFYDKVVQARILLETHKVSSVREAVKEVGISRSTYYKYKDYIFRPGAEFGRRFTLSMVLDDMPGLLSRVLLLLGEQGLSIVTIHQDIPINHAAAVIITVDSGDMDASVDELTQELLAIPGVNMVELMTME